MTEPGTILTFFPWEQVAPGRLGVGETQETVLRAPEGAIGFWTHRLLVKGVAHEKLTKRFGEAVFAFKDPDGMRVALVALPGIESEPAWSTDEIPTEAAIRSIHGVNLVLREAAPTGAVLTDVFGFAETAREGATIQFSAEGSDVGGIVDIREAGEFLRARQGGGSVHYIAFRAADDEAAFAMQRKLAENHGLRMTEQKDRHYFRSLYFREPGGVLFEIATDGPGFMADEPLDTLGGALKLSPQYEARRRQIEVALPILTD